MKKALVLSSGGVDSTTCIALAIENVGVENVTAVSVFYGQKHSKELECAQEISNYYKIEHKFIDLSNCGIFENSTCSLLKDSGVEIGYGSYEEQIKNSEIVNTYVPFRNGLILSAVSSLALSLYPEDEIDIYLGAHADDAAGNAYADCSYDFVKYLGKAICLGTYGKVTLKTPLVNLNKGQVVGVGLKLKAPYKLTWSCYEGSKKPCGKCGTCIDRQKAFEINGVVDPII